MSQSTVGLSTSDLRGSSEFATRSTPTGLINMVPIGSNLSTISKRSSGFKGSQSMKKDGSQAADFFVKDYVKKRNLILGLLSAEIEFLITWNNPMSLPENHIPGLIIFDCY